MDIKIDKLHYGYKFEKSYPTGHQCAEDFALIFEYLDDYKTQLKLRLQDDRLPDFKKIPLAPKIKKVEEFQEKYKSLIDFFADAAMDSL